MKGAWVGPGIFLLVVGAILYWAVSDRVPGVNLGMIGIIMMVGGGVAILLSFLVPNRTGYRATRSAHTDPATGGRVEQVDVDNRGV